MKDLGQYIEQQRQAGQVESAGSFTLAIEKARDKLSTYSFAQPEDYILKLVQCAVALKVDSLFIELQRDTVLVYFELEESNFSLSVDQLSGALLSPLDEPDLARSHLALALCAVAAQEPVELMWGDWGGDSSIILSLGHGRSELFRRVPFPRTQALEQNRRLHLLYLKKKSTTVSLSLTSKERKLLQERCCFAPLEIRLDGKELGPSLPTFVSASDPVRQLSGLYLGAFFLETQGTRSLRWPHQGKRKRKPHRLPAELKPIAPGLPPAFWVEQGSDCPLPLERRVDFSSLYGVPSFLYGPSHIYYVMNGVLLHPVVVHDAGGGAFAILDGNHLKTDLTGLQVIRNEALDADKEKVSLIWRQMVESFVSNYPPVFRNSLGALGEDFLAYMADLLLVGPLKRVFKPVLDHFVQNPRKLALIEKKFQRLLENRRGHLAYFRNQD